MIKFFIKSFGCQMNVADSDRMFVTLSGMDMEVASSLEDANLVILNTCHIREKASEKLFSELGRIREKYIIGVVGCVAQAMGDLVIARAPYVDFVLGPQNVHHLKKVVLEAIEKKEAKIKTPKASKPVLLDFDVIGKFRAPYEPRQDMGVSAFLTVQEGCDQFCAFCVVPYTRGANYSRPIYDIVDEAKKLASNNVREITLVGQNVNAYDGKDRSDKVRSLADLLSILGEKVPEILRWRYTTSHPVSMQNDLIDLHGSMPSLMPYLHLPLQSGSDKVLKIMNRKHTMDDYRRIIDRLRNVREDIALTTDILVGHPQENDEDFALTVKAISELNFAGGYFFKFSSRPGTPASVMSGQVDEKVKSERLSSVKCLFDAHNQKFLSAFKDKTVSVLFERPGRKSGQYQGRSSWMHAVHVDIDQDYSHLKGKELPCKVVQVMRNSLEAKLITGMHVG